MALTGTLAQGAPHPANPDAIEDGYPKRSPGPSDFDEAPDADDILAIDEVKAAKRVCDDWTEQDQLQSRPNAQARANRARRAGHINVQVVKAKDEDRYEEWTWGPPVPHGNKAATNCRKAAANITADPFAADPLPASSDPEDVDSSDFSAKVLEDILGPGELDDTNRGREAFDIASDSGSCFRYIWVDKRGRRQPLQIEAHPQATDAAQPFTVQVPATNAFGQPVTDPMTGQPAMQPKQMPGPYQLRYVTQDGKLTDKKSEAKLEWVPRIRDELLPDAHVRFLPATASYIDQADGVILGAFRSIAELKRYAPDKFAESTDPTTGLSVPAAIGEEEIAKMLRYRPDRPDDFLPGRGKLERSALDSLKGDNRLVFCLTEIWKSCDRYPMGAYICCGGDATVLHRGPWSATMEDGTEEPLEINLSQYLQMREGTQTKSGVALMTILGAFNEIRGAQLGAMFEHLDRFNSRKTFVPISSMAQPADLENPTSQYIPMNPGGEPVTEQVPEYPRMAVEVYDRAGDEADHASGLEAAAQGLEDPSVQSGTHAQTIITQVHAGLSELRENYIRGEIRTCRIILQLVRAFYTKPQQLTFDGKDGRTRQRRWNRADLGSTSDVQLRAATMTMMAPAAKLAFVNELIQNGMIPPEDARELMTNNLAKTLGWKDEPHRLRIKRQLADWDEGPPEGWAPPEPQMVTDPTTGAASLQPAPDPALQSIWDNRLCDQLPDVAQIRLLEISRFMASTSYERWPQQWRTGVDMAFQQMQMIVAQAAAAAAAAAQPGAGQPAQGPPQ